MQKTSMLLAREAEEAAPQEIEQASEMSWLKWTSQADPSYSPCGLPGQETFSPVFASRQRTCHLSLWSGASSVLLSVSLENQDLTRSNT